MLAMEDWIIQDRSREHLPRRRFAQYLGILFEQRIHDLNHLPSNPPHDPFPSGAGAGAFIIGAGGLYELAPLIEPPGCGK
jgi:hypothetical protein